MRAARRLLALVGSLAVSGLPAMAGGSHWRVIVESVSSDGDSGKLVVLRPMESGFAYGNCSLAIVHILDFDSRTYWDRFVAKLPVTRDEHFHAMDILEKAAIAKSPIGFGSMGTGLVSKPGNPCEFWSKGVEVVGYDDDRIIAVYSFHKWP